MITLLKADSSDAPSIFEIFTKARGMMTYLPDIHTEKETEDFILTLVKKGTVTVANIEGKTAGFIEYDKGWINYLYISPGFQNLGIGKKLLDYAKTDSKSLKLWVFEDNLDAIRFYEREGFVLDQKRAKDEADNEECLPDRLYFWEM